MTYNECLLLVQQAALHITNKVAYQPRAGYRTDCNGLTFWEASLKFDLERIARELLANNYKFEPFLKIKRQTTPNKIRDIYISTWRDKIVDYFLYKTLTQKFGKFYTEDVYAYRDRYGIDYCQYKLRKSIPENKFYAKRDIRNYFYSINHEILLQKLPQFIDGNLLDITTRRLKNKWIDAADENITGAITMGVPFGTSFACAVANVYLNDLDQSISSMPVLYFRYSDDILILSKSKNDIDSAVTTMEQQVSDLDLSFKESHNIDGELGDKSRVKFLGLLYQGDGTVLLPIEKQRKIMRLVNSTLRNNRFKISKLDKPGKIKKAVECVNEALTVRCRGVAIVDYYLKHINDEQQLTVIDRLIKERVVCAVYRKSPFKKGYLKHVSFKSLRNAGLVSLLHRSRLLRSNKINRPFMSLLNQYFLDRHENKVHLKRETIEMAALRRRNKKSKS
jgi:hypothetical protein